VEGLRGLWSSKVCEKSYFKGEVAVCSIIKQKTSGIQVSKGIVVRWGSLYSGDVVQGERCPLCDLNESDSLDGSLIRRIDL
jgi:hypothetical protein